MELKRINMDRIILSKKRNKYDEGEVFLLAKSIALAGLISPITVIATEHSDRFEIVEGNKRFFATRLLGYREINAIVIKADPYFAKALLKKGTYQDIFKEADIVKEAIIKTGVSAEEFSELTTYTVKEILTLLKISMFSELEKEIVRKNMVNYKVVAEIATFEDSTKRMSILSEYIKRRMTYGELKAYCEREKAGKVRLFKEFANKTVKFKDLRLFDNTITRAMKVLKEAGVKAELDTEKTNEGTEYKIKIKN